MQYNKYKPIIKSVAILSLVIGMIVIYGWIFNIENFRSVFHKYASMKFNTALCFVFSGCSLLLYFAKEKQLSILQRIFSVLIILIGAISFSESFFNIKTTGIDEFFVTDITAKITEVDTPGRMSSATAFCFILIGFSLFNINSKRFSVKLVTQWALQIVMLIGMIAIMSYIYKVPVLNKLSFLNSMAIHTALCFFCLSISLSLVNPSFGITGLFTGDKIGNIMARRLFPVIFFVILITTYLRLEVNRQNLIGMEFAAILFSTFFLLINLFMIWRTATELNKIDVKRKEAEESLLILNKQLEHKVEERTTVLQGALQQLETSQHELHEALNKEKELNEMKSRFVSMASHEFKTPLSTILSSASLISSYVKPEDQFSRDKHVMRIKNSVKHLNHLLEDFLSLGKLEENRISTDATHFNLKEFLEEIMEEIKVGIKAHQKIELEQNGLDRFVTDKRLLKNILLNILSNAVKFSAEDGVIFIELNNKENHLFISVKDNGIGVLKEDQQYLFSSFFRGRNTMNIEGTGLGLHIVKRYVDLLKGTISLQSEPEKGTIVIIQLPQLTEKTPATFFA